MQSKDLQVPASTPFNRARAMFGEHFLGPKEVSWYFGVTYSQRERRKLGKIPWSEAVLLGCVGDHVLFAGYPLSIDGIEHRADEFYEKIKLDKSGRRNLFCSNNPTGDFRSKEKVGLRWYLIRKWWHESLDKTYIEQEKLFGANKERPRACEVVYLTILLYLKTNEVLFAHDFVRCRDPYIPGMEGSHIGVGLFDRSSYGLRVVRLSDDPRRRLGEASIGTVSSRLPGR